MVNSHDQVELVRDFKILLEIGIIFGGIYLWEFFTTIDYEWDFIRGRRPYRWTIWIYSVSRLVTLIAVIMNMIGANANIIDCQVMVSLGFTFSNIALSLASLLILVRIAAIWNKNKPVLTLATCVWITNVAFLIQGAARIRSRWVPETQTCAPPNVETSKPTLITTLSTDIALLLIMLVGLFRLRCHSTGWFDLGHLLWKQGVIWLSLASITELIPVVFMCLNLNVAFDMMFLQPTFITMTIAATWMHRSLSDFCSPTGVSKNPTNFRRTRRSTRYGDFANNSNNRVEVAIHTTHEHYVTSPKGQCVSLAGMGHLCDKAGELSVHESAKSSV